MSLVAMKAVLPCLLTVAVIHLLGVVNKNCMFVWIVQKLLLPDPYAITRGIRWQVCLDLNMEKHYETALLDDNFSMIMLHSFVMYVIKLLLLGIFM